jgi:hypothetical protein
MFYICSIKSEKKLKNTKMKTYQHITTIEIDDIYHVVSIDFEVDNDGNPEILKITDLETTEVINENKVWDLDGLYKSLHEFAADFEADNKRGKSQPVNYNSVYR